MAKTIKRGLIFLLCFITLFCATAVNVPYDEAEARTLFDVENEISAYKSELTKLQNELSQINSNIAELEGQSGQTTELLKQYQGEIEALELEISINEAIMDSYDLKRAEVISEITIIREDYDYRVSMYKKLMQFIYENSSVNTFELLFSSDNFSDYLTRRDNYNDIMNAANDLIKNIEVSLADLEVLDKELSETQAKYDEYLTDLNRSKLERESKVEEFKTIAAELNLNSDELAVQYGEKNAQINAIKAKIKALEEERMKMFNSNAAFLWPVKTSTFWVTSLFGWRGNPFGGAGTEFHQGFDIACAKGTPIVAVKDGVVTRASYNGGYGECVVIYHGNGVSTLYAHCDNTSQHIRPVYEVKVGDSVKAGQVVAYVGTTGRSTGYHLHFSVLDTNSYSSVAGNYVDPGKYLPKVY
ncbi:MAG: peptidoglycan DD-metalloendopeptidase family protein [Clostridia bacterium]|nr:peptidoglycan DD-metalloendopeptidase family protein [Clostridia bacterium]